MSADFLTLLRLTAALEYNSTFPVFRGTRLAAKSKIEKLHALCCSFLLADSLPADGRALCSYSVPFCYLPSVPFGYVLSL